VVGGGPVESQTSHEDARIYDLVIDRDISRGSWSVWATKTYWGLKQYPTDPGGESATHC
jgi:hypothetical protein